MWPNRPGQLVSGVPHRYVSDMELPYFDQLIAERRSGDPAAEIFSRYVHWGLWPRFRGASVNDGEFADAMRRLDDHVADGAALADGMTVADVGCGFGGTLSRLCDRLPDARFVGVNIDHRQLVEAVKSRANFVCADGCALPLRGESFDAVLAVECIFHFPSRLGFLHEAGRILKPGGRVSLSDFVPFDVNEREDPAREWFERQVGKTYGTFGGWSDGNYETMATKAGLVLERFDDVTTRTLPTYRYLVRRYFAQKRAGGKPPPISPTVLLAVLSAARLVRYRTVVLRKPK